MAHISSGKRLAFYKVLVYNNFAMAGAIRDGVRGMKATGIVRRIDELGRIVLPIELRRNMNLDVHDPVEIFLEGDSIVLRRYESSCVFCGETHGLIAFRGKQLCSACVRQLKES